MGLLDGLFSDDPKQQALMAMAMGLLGGAPNSRKNVGNDIAHAGMLGMGAFTNQRVLQAKLQEEEQQKQMRAMQMQQMRGQQEQQGRIDALAPKHFNPGAPLTPNDDMGNPNPASPSFNMKGYAQDMMGIDPMRGFQLQQALTPKPNVHTLSEGARAVDFDTGRTVADNPKPQGPKEGDIRKYENRGKVLTYEFTKGEWKKLGESDQYKPEGAEKPRIYDGPNGPVWVTPPGAGAPTQPVAGPDGQPIGAKKRDQPLTEAQGNATAYAMRAMQSEQTLRELEKAGHNPAAFPGVGNRLAGGPLNVLAPEQAQQYNAAKKNFVTAVLRKESGAAISQSEFDNEDQKYFPQPGDGPATRKQKEKARELAIEALKIQAGPGAKSGGASAGWSIKPL